MAITKDICTNDLLQFSSDERIKITNDKNMQTDYKQYNKSGQLYNLDYDNNSIATNQCCNRRERKINIYIYSFE